MKFFSINHSFCKNCAQCERLCPVNALTKEGENYTIDYAKCIACGVCFKTCPQNAIEFNLDKEKIERWEQIDNKNLELEEKLNALSEENRRMKEELFTLGDRFRNIVDKLPYGIAIIDKSNKIVMTNTALVAMLDYEMRSLAKENEGLEGVDITTALPESICNSITESLYRGEDNLNKEIALGKHCFNMSTYAISKSNFALVMFRDIFDEQILKEEISNRIQEVIDQNMAMIQNISFFMGEGTSKTTKTLNSIISSLKHTPKR